jgi:hypothetical protein
MPKRLDPAEAAKRAVLSDSATLEALGRIVAECGLAWTPTEILVGALTEISDATQSYDREKLDRWRETGEKILGERKRQSASKRRPRSAKGAASQGEGKKAGSAPERAPASQSHEQSKEGSD